MALKFRVELVWEGDDKQTASSIYLTGDGRVITEAEWDARRREWLPTPEDAQFVATLMRPAVEPGRFAGWIAPPARGINGLPLDHEYVRLTRKEG